MFIAVHLAQAPVQYPARIAPWLRPGWKADDADKDAWKASVSRVSKLPGLILRSFLCSDSVRSRPPLAFKRPRALHRMRSGQHAGPVPTSRYACVAVLTCMPEYCHRDRASPGGH